LPNPTIGNYTITFTGTTKLDAWDDWVLTPTAGGALPAGCNVISMTCTIVSGPSASAVPFTPGTTSGTGVACVNCTGGGLKGGLTITLSAACV
jgi:hypothetical protein